MAVRMNAPIVRMQAENAKQGEMTLAQLIASALNRATSNIGKCIYHKTGHAGDSLDKLALPGRFRTANPRILPRLAVAFVVNPEFSAKMEVAGLQRRQAGYGYIAAIGKGQHEAGGR